MSATKPDVPVERVPVSRLSPHPRNPREGDVGAIVESLLAFGQFRPIVVQRRTPDGEPRNVVIAGTHTWRAHQAIQALTDDDLKARDLPPDTRMRFDAIDAALLDVSDEDAVRIMLADNQTHDLGRNRPDVLAEILTELGYQGMTGTGFDGESLDTILRDLGRYDPGADILRDFAHLGDAPSDRQELVKGRSSDGTEYYALHVSLTEVQRAQVLAAFARAKEQGYATQPEALAEMARKFVEG